ncbi:UTP--glucose-1-phosphate uridylyltransferase [Shouchella patagoniensis]|uniref:UTP--glucose-1-phosphate uridylyltransferase n=1 Tax=Shouchella patagoniensis TaxID=228576 RepID=UPI001FE7FB6D|nr:UTP--glucose-1-phosphate uridylyltransferase [Shouchella patagoniensis]
MALELDELVRIMLTIQRNGSSSKESYGVHETLNYLEKSLIKAYAGDSVRMKNEVRKAIIPTAELGSQFIPVTKVQQKEMLPIVNKLAIQYIVEEAVQSGIEDIIIVVCRTKDAINYDLDKLYELETLATRNDYNAMLEEVKQASNFANIHYLIQNEPRGLGDAILQASSFIGNEPFAVLLGDDVVKSTVPCLMQMMNVYSRYHSSVVGVDRVEYSDVSKYGMVSPKGESIDTRLFHVETFLEEDSKYRVLSNLALMGRYILRPEVFQVLESLSVEAFGDIELTSALIQLNEEQAILAYEFDGNA